MTSEDMMKYMREHGIGGVTARFTGHGDSGECEAIVVMDDNGKKIVDFDQGEDAFRRACEERCWEAIEDLASDFGSDEGGEVQWCLMANGDVIVYVRYNEPFAFWSNEFIGHIDLESGWQRYSDGRLVRAHAMLGEAARLLKEVAQGCDDKDLCSRIDDLMQRLAHDVPDVVGDDSSRDKNEAQEVSRDDPTHDVGR
jgi:hypothetical protein